MPRQEMSLSQSRCGNPKNNADRVTGGAVATGWNRQVKTRALSRTTDKPSGLEVVMALPGICRADAGPFATTRDALAIAAAIVRDLLMSGFMPSHLIRNASQPHAVAVQPKLPAEKGI